MKQKVKRKNNVNYVKGAVLTNAVACEISSDTTSCLSIRQEGFGLMVSQEYNTNLKIGDQVLKVDRENVY